MPVATEEQQKTLEKQMFNQISQQTTVNSFSDPGTGFLVYFFLVIFIILILSFFSKIHDRAIKTLEFIVSVPLYKRTTVFLIGLLSAYVTSKIASNIYYIPITVGYISTFAFNEFASKKDIEKATKPLNEKIAEKDTSIDKLRIIIEEKKNNFYTLIFSRVSGCLRVKGRDDSELLRKTRQKIEELQDIILAEKTFMETPDEALRRFDNSTSGDTGLTSQTMVFNSQVIETASN